MLSASCWSESVFIRSWHLKLVVARQRGCHLGCRIERLELRSKAYCVAEAGLLEKRRETHALPRRKIGAVAGAFATISSSVVQKRLILLLLRPIYCCDNLAIVQRLGGISLHQAHFFSV